MKKIISYFIKFPVAVNVLIVAFVVFGILGATSMLSSFFPLSDSQLITIQLVYPGASPAEMEEGVVLKIEDNLKGLIGIDRVTSVSRENSASISIETLKGEDIDVILADVKNAVDRVPSFPSELEPPIVSKVESVRPTIIFTISGENIPLATLKEYARNVENDLRSVPGISQVNLTGFPDQEIAIYLRENDLRAYNLSFREVASAVSNSNLLITGGNVKTNAEDYLIRASHRKYYGKELNHLVVRALPNGHIIRLADIADIQDTWSEDPDRIFFNGKKAIQFTVSNTNNEDLISSAEKVNEYIDKFNQEHRNVQLSIANDWSIPLVQRTQLLAKNAWMGVALVMLFLAMFLNARLAFWVAFGIPVAFFGMFMFAANLGVTINVLSLFGMIIVIGILVDDGIVIGENIYHHYEKGKTPIRAAIDGTLEVVPPIISAILTTIIAFSTFFFLDGSIGNFFSEVSVVVTLTLLVSLVEALIILPAHIAHSKALQKQGRKYNRVDLFFRKINSWADRNLMRFRDAVYVPFLKFFLANKFLGFAIPISLLILSIASLRGGIVSSSFFPRVASDMISINLKMPQGTNEQITDSIISSIEEKVWEVNQNFTEKQTGNQSVIQNVVKRIGPGTANANLTVNLLPGEARDFSSFEINSAFRKAVGTVSGVESLIFGSGSDFGGSPVSISLLGNNITELKAAKEDLKVQMRAHPELKDISDNDPVGIKEIQIQLKDKAYNLGLNLQSVMFQIRSGFFGLQAQRFQRGQDEIRVWVRYRKADRSSIKNLDDMYIQTPSGGKVPFSEIGTYQIQRGEVAINHLEGKREIQINADLKTEDANATQILDDLRADVVPEILAKYPTVKPLYEGQNREAGKTIDSMKKTAPVILLIIYVVIAFTFRTYSQPLILMLMIPFSLIGVIWGHWIHNLSVNILSWLGIIALIGILINDGLVLISKFNNNLKEGLPYKTALLEAGKMRFRAIFLTTITTIAGLAPLIFETSRQAKFLIPMAISISYGIAIATVLTLVMLPLMLDTFNDLAVFVKWLQTGNKVTKEEVERAIIEAKNNEEH